MDNLKLYLTACNADCVLAVGGGSVIGACKAAALQLQPQNADQNKVPESAERGNGHLLVAAVPTTYSGSEMTNIFGISSGGSKQTGRSEKVRPRVVLYDSTLVGGRTREDDSNSLFNALAHCVEALWAAPEAKSPVTALTAQAGVKAITDALKTMAKASRSSGSWAHAG